MGLLIRKGRRTALPLPPRRELITFEAKIEHDVGNSIVPYYIGQAHNQLSRAKKEYETKGFTIRGTIVTHLTDIDDSAKSSIGEIRIIKKNAVQNLWKQITLYLNEYRNNWSLEDAEARQLAAESIINKFPPSGWLTRALSTEKIWIEESDLLQEWS